jgi:hypothetical protein
LRELESRLTATLKPRQNPNTQEKEKIMELVTINAVTTHTVNPYIEDVKALLKATKEFKGEAGTAPAGQFTVANNEVAKTVFYIQQAAIAEGVTARIASKQTNGLNSKGSETRIPVPEVDSKGVATGKTVLLFKIAPKRKENGRAPRNTGEAASE